MVSCKREKLSERDEEKHMTEKKRGLGRGLSDLGLNELLGDLSNAASPDIPKQQAELKKLPIEAIHPGRYQPRQHIMQEGLEELASSIKSQGIIQPIVVRNASDGYEIIAGERRWRAAQLAELTEVPVIIRDIPDEAAIAMSLIENIQRQDLNVIEEAIALQRLIDEFHMTHQGVADAIGKSRASVTNTLRLLKLNPDVRSLVEQGHLDMGHARALLALEGLQQSEIANNIVERALSVRDTEKLIRQLQENNQYKHADSTTIDPDVARLQNSLSDKLGAVVIIRHNTKGKGKLVVHYNSVDELEGILNKIH